MRNLTTGECATYCQVASRTVQKWLDTGLLKGFTIPGSKHRRVPQENLVVFMKEHGIPVPDELQVVECAICGSHLNKGQRCNCLGAKS